MKRVFDPQNELEEPLVYTFNDIWSYYQRFLLANFKPKHLGGIQKLTLPGFPEILYVDIWKKLFPQVKPSSSFDFANENIESLNYLFGDGVFNESGWCCITSIDNDNNKSKLQHSSQKIWLVCLKI